MKTLTLFSLRSTSILALYQLILFNILNISSQISNKVTKNNESTEILPTIDGCKNVLICERVETRIFFNLELGICEKCKDRPLDEECSSISTINNAYQLLSFTNGFDKELHGVNGHDKIDSMIEKGQTNESAILFLGKFANLSGVKHCALDENNQIELLQEIYLIYNQHKNSEDLTLNIKLTNPFQAAENKTLEIISNWKINSKKSNHAIYAYKKIKEQMFDEKSKSNSDINSQIFNKIFPSINVIFNSTNEQIFDNLKTCMRISCRKQKEKGYNNTHRVKNKVTVYDIISSVNLLKRKVKSENDYLFYVNVLIKTLLKSLERKTKLKKISIGCTIKIISWVKELCEILGIKTDENSNMGRNISEFSNNTKEEPNFSKKTINVTNIAKSKQNIRFKEAELEDYKKLEEELKEF
ncbi:hypothetical protein CmeUKMEL1_04155 [Cryptosporidium meleagridis]|uniref:Uncharacterized protein n=1 Tax=Cryptosporidium meleagridis TaxID=93969 RepID=A0A2P4YY97_9CRYT|nr:hypothetical protein CmeUKMEL1_04155 [Cryptosporidium meleagridis]